MGTALKSEIYVHSGQVYSLRFQVPTDSLETVSLSEGRDFFYLANTEDQFCVIQKISVVSLLILHGKDGEW